MGILEISSTLYHVDQYLKKHISHPDPFQSEVLGSANDAITKAANKGKVIGGLPDPQPVG